MDYATFEFESVEQREWFSEDYTVARVDYDSEMENEFQNLYRD